MQAFIPPEFNLPVAWAVDFTLPALLKVVQNIDEVIIHPQDRALLRTLRNKRLIYASNHPTNGEPPVAYFIANVMGARFHYMAARQVFDWGSGFVGKFIQGLGAFSVIAGVPDRDSLKTARGLLSRESGKLVLFPEGEPTSGENDNLLPFQPGVAQLGFWAFEDARKLDPKADVMVLPSFVKYVITGTDGRIKSELHSAITKIEKSFSIDPGNKNLLRRFLTVGRVMLEEAERDYSVPVASRKDYDYRVGRVRHTILDNVAEKLKVENYEKRADAIVKLRHLLAVIEMIEVKIDDPRLPEVKKAELDFAKRECQKAYDFIVVKPEYLISRPSPERFFEWLARFETYVYGQTKPRARKAHVRIARPLSLSSYYPAYKKNKRETVDTVTRDLRLAIQALLETSLDITQPIVRPYEVGDDII